MPALAFLLLLAAASPDAGQAWSGIEDRPALTQPSGPGLWIGGVAFGREDIAEVVQLWDPETGIPAVFLTFSDAGHGKFARVQQGRIEQILEIALDGELLSSPVLMELIEGRDIMISGGLTEAEAAALAERLGNLR